MLQAIRERAQGVMAWVILILITVPFALWGIQNYLGGGKEKPVAVVGDQEFFQRDVSRAYEQTMQSLLGFGDVDEKVVRRQALEKLISDEVLAQEVADSGLVISDESARRFISTLDYFQTDGKFDKKKYDAVLASQNMSPREFAEKVRRAMVMDQYQDSVVGSAFATAYDVDRYFRLQNQERAIEYVIVPLKATNKAVSDDEINTYYQSHLESYKTPERVSIDYIELSLDALAKKIVPTDAQLQAFYGEQKDLYTTKERREVSHILVSVPSSADASADAAALAKANAIRDRLNNEDFAAVAKEVSDDKVSAKSGGDLGLISRGMMESNFEEAAYALAKGEISQPIKTSFGYHLIKVSELEPETVKPFDAVKAEVAAAYQRNEAENKFYELGERLGELAYENPDNLTKAAETLGLEIHRSELFIRETGTGIAADPAIRKAAFEDDVLGGNNSEPIELGTDRVVVLRVNEHLPAETQSLDQVREEIRSAIQKQKALEETRTTAEEIHKKVRAGKTLAAVAGEHRLDVQRPGFIGRSAEAIPIELRRAVFKASKPAEGASKPELVALSDGTHAIVTVLKVKDAGADKADAQQRKMAEDNMAKSDGRQAFNAVLTDLRNQADVTVYGESPEE